MPEGMLKLQFDWYIIPSCDGNCPERSSKDLSPSLQVVTDVSAAITQQVNAKSTATFFKRFSEKMLIIRGPQRISKKTFY